MTTREKLKLLQNLSGLTQAELAGRLGVTFAALNRWMNEKAVPRKGAAARIDELYKEYSGEKQISETVLGAKKKFVLRKRDSHKNALKEILANPDIKDEFWVALTYHSNRIEGNTLSENETAAILLHNAILPDKSLVEQLEAKNHQAALEYLFSWVLAKKPLNQELILKLHGILMNAVQSDAGAYRRHAVRILGSYVPTANYQKVPNLMKKLTSDLARDQKDTIARVASVHSRLEQIHPFSAGNGRVGRLLMQAMLLKKNLPPAIIRQEKRRLYYVYLSKAQTKMDQSSLEDFICDAILEGFKILEREE